MSDLQGIDEAVSHWGPSRFDREIVSRVWQNAQTIPGNDSELWRKDEFGAWIHRLEYGNRRSEYGWEILEPRGADSAQLFQLRPMQWQNYVDQVAAHTQSRMTAAGLRNLRQLL